ncbi:hypothetical protein [Burkholderia anthina]|uniref:hypothetical protein n=1 Tax=Burkholderia anthina TaxID=179879 RepID=UPI00158DB1C4|nr:hypothetical protein [Burkholderia anthina]
MIYVYLNHEYHNRETGAWVRQQDSEASDDCVNRNYFAGYCLDAVLMMPAGSMQRLDPEGREPFAAPSYSYRLY